MLEDFFGMFSFFHSIELNDSEALRLSLCRMTANVQGQKKCEAFGF